MRRTFISAFVVTLVAGALFAQEGQPSLGDLARAQRNAKKSTTSTHVITNDDLAPAKESTPSATAEASTDKAADVKPASDAKAAQPTAAKKDDTAAKTDEKQASPEMQYRSAVKAQRATIEKLEKEVADRDHQIKVTSTNYYLDAGSRLRDPKAWTEQRTKLEKEMTTKQEELQQAKAKLDDLLEQARKLGIPSSVLE